MTKKTTSDLMRDAAALRAHTEALSAEMQKATAEIAATAEELSRRLRHVKATRELSTPIGDDTTTAVISSAVERLLRERPMLFRDLLEATGARDNRIKGVIMRLQREGVDVVNLGNEQRALWFIPNQELLKRLRARRR